MAVSRRCSSSRHRLPPIEYVGGPLPFSQLSLTHSLTHSLPLAHVFQSTMICSVCSDRQKDTVIKKCMHIFCSPCIQKNLQSRERRCPGCNIKFSESDVATLWL